MAMGKIEDRIKKMKEAIKSEAAQRAIGIAERAEDEADIERNSIMKEEREKIDAEFSKLQQAERVKAKMYEWVYSAISHQL
jgi:vacuolar-type H+-ATPase subunit H